VRHSFALKRECSVQKKPAVHCGGCEFRTDISEQQKWLEGETSVSEMQKAVRQPEEAQRERADTAAAAHATILVTVLEPRSLRLS